MSVNLNEYGPFASIAAIAAALLSLFSIMLLKSVGRVSQWTWLIHETPPTLVTAGARTLSVALIALTFILINKNNYGYFALGAVLFGLFTAVLIASFDRQRKSYIYKVPVIQANGQQARDNKGRLLFENLVIGDERDINPEARTALDNARRTRGGLSLTDFMTGYGAKGTNNPEALWSRSELARISNRMTTSLMGIILCGVMAFYLASASIAVFQR